LREKKPNGFNLGLFGETRARLEEAMKRDSFKKLTPWILWVCEKRAQETSGELVRRDKE